MTRVLFGSFIWTVKSVRMATRVGEERRTRSKWSKYRFFFEYRDEGVMFPVMLPTKEQGYRHSHGCALTWMLYLHIWRCFSRALLSRKFSPSPYPTAPEQFHRVRILRKSCRRIFTMTSFILL